MIQILIEDDIRNAHLSLADFAYFHNRVADIGCHRVAIRGVEIKDSSFEKMIEVFIHFRAFEMFNMGMSNLKIEGYIQINRAKDFSCANIKMVKTNKTT